MFGINGISPKLFKSSTMGILLGPRQSKKEKLVHYCLGQPAASTAQELVVAVARPDYWKVNQKRMLTLIDEMGEKAPKSVRNTMEKLYH